MQGPYLVRSASITANGTLELTGDLESGTQDIKILAPSVSTVTWNGKALPVTSKDGNLIVATVDGPDSIVLPSLGPWTWQDSLPEIQSNYSASSQAWVGKFPRMPARNTDLKMAVKLTILKSVADITNSSNPTPPATNNPVLYVDEYHIHFGTHLYRAIFPSTSNASGVYLSITGGSAFGYSAWLNGDFIGSYLGASTATSGAVSLSFANATLASNSADNILIIVMDNSGHDETTGATNPRGITNATLLGTDTAFSEWKIAGTAGRESNIDPIRGVYNEGGLYAERIGAHLPGFPDASWSSSCSSNTTDGSSRLTVPGAGIHVFRTTVPLSIPDGLDVSIAFQFSAPGNGSSSSTFVSEYTNEVRALLFVNGYQYGRFNPYIGNQINFPVPTGILNYNGDNTIVVTVWSQSAEGAEVRLDWALEYVHSTGYDFDFDAEYLRPGWTSDRLAYA